MKLAEWLSQQADTGSTRVRLNLIRQDGIVSINYQRKPDTAMPKEVVEFFHELQESFATLASDK